MSDSAWTRDHPRGEWRREGEGGDAPPGGFDSPAGVGGVGLSPETRPGLEALG